MRWRPRRPSLSDQPHGAASRRGCRVACGGGLFAPISCKVRGGAGWGKCERADKPGSVVGRPFISNACRQTPQARNPNVRRATVSRSYLRLLRMGFSKPRRCRRAGALLPHRFSFSPVAARRSACSRGSFLFCGTNPSGRPAQPLAGILPCGARTFLTPRCAIVWPARIWYSSKPKAARAREKRSSAKNRSGRVRPAGGPCARGGKEHHERGTHHTLRRARGRAGTASG